MNLESLKPYLKDISYYEATITGFGKYICDEFDVLKCDIDSNSIIETNKEIFKHFHCYSRAKIFLPHLTIAYLKKGEADKYILKHFTDKIELVPKEFMWSWVDKDLVRQTLYFK